ncbi:MAG: radical SAM protein, partial [Clostridia bacterium]|nr:radical SAM protein [Clostridia bacterium]
MRVAFLTLGCKVNTYETEVMAQAFRAAGDQVVSFEEEADVYVVNTCTVTATGDKKSRQALRAAKRRNPAALVAAVGCYAQVAEQTLRAMPEVDVVLGNLHKPELPQLVRRHLQGAPLPPLPEILKERRFEPMEAVHSDRTRAALKVQDGCCNFCSYCIIPYARGPVRSKPEEDAAREFAALLREGYREIVLTGIEIASYGEGAGEEGSLLSLLTRLVALLPEGGDARIRLGSLEPRVVTEEFAAFLGQHPAICPQFHLSLQSG